MTAASPPRPHAPPRLDTNRPKSIFLGWTALVFIAGFGYYYAKQANLAKRKDMMRSGADVGNPNAQGAQTASAAEGRGAAPAHGGEKSPLQMLLGQINRQTSQRRRTDD